MGQFMDLLSRHDSVDRSFYCNMSASIARPTGTRGTYSAQTKGARSRCFLGFYTLSSFRMVPVLKLLEFLRIIRVTAKRFPGRCSSLLAVLRRKLSQWWQRLWLGNSQRSKPADRPFCGTEASARPVSGGSAAVSEYVVAASRVPASASASQSSLHERRPAAVGVHHPVPPTLSADPHDYPSNPLGGEGVLNRSTGNLSTSSVQSRASADRRSIITNSRESIRAPLDQPSRLPRGTHRQFGRGPDPSRSRERPTDRPTPATGPDTRLRAPSITTSLRSVTHGDDRVSLAVQSAASSFTYEQRSRLPSLRSQSTMMTVDIQNPSTDSLSSIIPAQRIEEPFAIDSPTVHSPDSSAVDLRLEQHHGRHEPGSPTPSIHSTIEYFIPEGRIVQLIHSEQVPRYTKAVTMQVGYTVLSLNTYPPL